MKLFQINTPVLFKPPNPAAAPNAPVKAGECLSFANFYQSYFGNANMSLYNQKCTGFLAGMKKCYENHPSSAASSCAYYIDGFKRAACSQ